MQDCLISILCMLHSLGVCIMDPTHASIAIHRHAILKAETLFNGTSACWAQGSSRLGGADYHHRSCRLGAREQRFYTRGLQQSPHRFLLAPGCL
eukprot:1013248-Pelagomonas_calceolata.AAC.2